MPQSVGVTGRRSLVAWLLGLAFLPLGGWPVGPAVAVPAPTSSSATSSDMAPEDGARDVPGRTWWVAIDGDDGGPGTSAEPFATWQRGVDAARAGDQVLVGPGTYEISGFRYAGVTLARSGEPGAPITLAAADPTTPPVLDCSGLDYDGNLSCLFVRGDRWHVRDIEVTGTPQPTGETPSAVLVGDARRVVLDRVESHHNAGTGIRVYGDSRHTVLRDCDAHHNADPGTSVEPYGNADGIAVSFLPRSAVGIRVVGCRSWANSDDGFDLWLAEAPVTIRRSWAFENGYVPDTDEPAGNGQGFKLGRNETGPTHRVVRSLAFANRTFGFDHNAAAGPLVVTHSTAAGNGAGGFGFDSERHVLRNNLAVGRRGIIDPRVDDRSNSWTLDVRVTRGDLRSLAASGAAGPRRPGGGLPRLSFLRLQRSSDLVDAGQDLGEPFRGRAPDLGAFES